MAISLKFFEPVLLALSELEAFFVKPNDSLWFRRLYFRHCGVRFATPLWVGRKFRLLWGHKVSLGKRCAFGDFVQIIAWEPVSIGRDFTGSSGLHLNTGGHDAQTMKPHCGAITIGDRVWCGVNVTILSGVTIGDDVVIGAGSVVCQDVPSCSIAVGVPARVIKSLQRNQKEKFWTWAV
jgi:acetyltransferase-like isoleucine patch superfamily enzyme